MKNKKGQQAMEFLMTYGWAILVVLIAIGALAYFGVLAPPSQSCSCEDINQVWQETKTYGDFTYMLCYESGEVGYDSFWGKIVEKKNYHLYICAEGKLHEVENKDFNVFQTGMGETFEVANDCADNTCSTSEIESGSEVIVSVK